MVRLPRSTALLVAVALTVPGAAGVPREPAAAATDAPRWRVDVRVLPAVGDASAPVALLLDGSVVGNDATPDGSRAWLWSPAAGRRELPRAGAPYSRATAAADSGMIVGQLGPASVLPAGGAVRWRRAGAPRPLVPDAAVPVEAQRVNNRGDALVVRPTAFLPTDVTLVTVDGTVTPLAPGGAPVQTGISLNDRREAVYSALGAGASGAAYVWRDGVSAPLGARYVRLFPFPCVSRLTDTGFLAWSGVDPAGRPRFTAVLRHDDVETVLPDGGAASSEIACTEDAVNDLGHVAGAVRTAPAAPPEAVLWRGLRPPVALGTLPGGVGSQSVAVDDLDVVLANSLDDAGTARPFLWLAGARVELPVPAGFDRVTATLLNDRGQAAGTAERLAPDGSVIQTRPVLWNPRPST